MVQGDLTSKADGGAGPHEGQHPIAPAVDHDGRIAAGNHGIDAEMVQPQIFSKP